ncbi:hypothetical protein ACFV9C_26190 [Kribbella sp. NPDC059898]|uniref:hypothetical protein n=1 Tax=Kribbella sp. NPDC059898 TaxID=3346995 RepID=UPI003648A9E0
MHQLETTQPEEVGATMHRMLETDFVRRQEVAVDQLKLDRRTDLDASLHRETR